VRRIAPHAFAQLSPAHCLRYGARMNGGASGEACAVGALAANSTRLCAMRWHWQPFASLSGADLHAALALRSAVFVVEQACVYLDPDEHDSHAHHLLGFIAGAAEAPAELAGYLRVIPPGRRYPEPSIGRVVTSARYRGVGLGRSVMREGIARTRATYAGAAIRISAQAYLRAFYESLGFRTVSSAYLEDGIPHVEMLLDAAAGSDSCAQSPSPGGD